MATTTSFFVADLNRCPNREKIAISGQNTSLKFQVKRWIDPSKLGWWSGDHHIHAAGCAHYSRAHAGRACAGHGAALHGRGFENRREPHLGSVLRLSKAVLHRHGGQGIAYPFLLRYDVEVSGFGSHKSGHLCLLKLKEQMYPGGDSTAHWPTLCLNTLEVGEKAGRAHRPRAQRLGTATHRAPDQPTDGRRNTNGLLPPPTSCPNYIIPPFNGIGANEYIVDVTHMVEGPDGKPVPAVDFLSMVDTPHTWELNIWYHTLNAGFRTRVSGETDFPCIYGERVGLGRAYVKLDGKLTYDAWCEGIRAGRAYVSDGKSHLIDFKANDVELGVNGSELKLAEARHVKVTVKAAALLDTQPRPDIKNAPAGPKALLGHRTRPHRHLTRSVPVELLVNGVSVAKKTSPPTARTRI
jgi:hypothetical protein